SPADKLPSFLPVPRSQTTIEFLSYFHKRRALPSGARPTADESRSAVPSSSLPLRYLPVAMSHVRTLLSAPTEVKDLASAETTMRGFGCRRRIVPMRTRAPGGSGSP